MNNTFEQSTSYLNKKGNTVICVAVMMPFLVLSGQYLMLIYFNLMDTAIGNRVQLISKIIVGITYLCGLPYVLKRSKTQFALVYGIAVLLFAFHYAFFEENRSQIEEVLTSVLFMNIPAYIYAQSITDLAIFKSIMMKTSYVVLGIGVLIGILVFAGRTSFGGYSMSLSYYLLLPSLLFLDDFIDRFSVISLMFGGLAILIILALGSRGALLCILVFLILKFLKPNIKRTSKRVFLECCIFACGVVLFFLFDNIIYFLHTFFLKYGIISRSTVLLMLEKTHMSGRERLYGVVIDELMKKPVIGLGIAGDIRLIGNGYVHNFFLEILSHYGLILGSALLIVFVITVFKALKSKNETKYNLAIIWLCLGFVHLLVSGSYLIDMKFWVFLGIITGFFLKKKSLENQ